MQATFGTLRQLGYELITSEAVAINELIKNAIDAGAANIDIKFYKDKVILTDNGSGISQDTMEEIANYISLSGKRGANQHGDKGLGRLSTQRMGNKLTITTWNKKEARRQEMDWSALEKNMDADISQFSPRTREIDRRTWSCEYDKGTQIEINDLLKEWDKEDVERFINSNYKKFFNVLVNERPIKIRFFYNDEELISPSFPPHLLGYAHASFKVEYVSESRKVKYLVTSKDGAEPLREERDLEISCDEVRSYFVNQGRKKDRKGEILREHLKCDWDKINDTMLTDVGDFEIDLYWINRQRLMREYKGYPQILGSSARQEVEKVNEWSTVGLYRDNIMVYPYGIESSDWLAFDASALSRQGYKFNRQQLIGAVSISKSQNKNLKDTTNRQELTRNDEYQAFIMLCYYLINLCFFDAVTQYKDKEKKKKKSISEIERWLADLRKISLKCQMTAYPCKILAEVLSLKHERTPNIMAVSLRTLLETCLRYEMEQPHNKGKIREWMKENKKSEPPDCMADMVDCLKKNRQLRESLEQISQSTKHFLNKSVHGISNASVPRVKDLLGELTSVISIIASGRSGPQ